MSPADKARMFGIVRGEVGGVGAAAEIAAVAGDATQEAAERCGAIAGELMAVLTGLVRR